MDISKLGYAYWTHSLNRLDSYLKDIAVKEKNMSEAAIVNRQLSITRVYNAPREVVFEVCTKAEHIRKWFGCREMQMTECEIDARVGGEYRFVTVGEGFVCPLKGEFFEVIHPEKLVFSQIYDVEPYSASVAMVTTTLKDLGCRTELTSTIVFPDSESYAGAMASGMEVGMGEALDRLGQVSEALN